MTNIIPLEVIENKILLIRGQKVMLDRDLAELYGVDTRALNQAVKRNKYRFPGDFMFNLSREEIMNLSQFVISDKKNSENKLKGKNLKSQIVISSWGGSRTAPYVFTELGVAMLSSVLKSKQAIDENIAIMRTFVRIRRMAASHDAISRKIEKIERSQEVQGKTIGEVLKILDRLFVEKEDDKKDEIGFKIS